MPEFRGISSSGSHLNPSSAPPTSPVMCLLAVRAQARFPRCWSVCGCIVRFVLRSGPECCCPKILEIRSLT